MADNWLLKLDKRSFDDAKLIGEEAAKFGCRSYLVGGIVRDLILGRVNSDLDIVIEGNAIQLGKHLAGVLKLDIVCYAEFKTAKLFDAKGRHVDLTSSRREFYPKPAALPVVDEGNLQADLFRRDFTINALALSLYPASFGQLIDMYGGLEDLHSGKIKVFHGNSFNDDPTRILRAIRFEQRFNFTIEEKTAELLKKAVKGGLHKKLSDPRFFSEFRKILREEDPVRPLSRLKELGLLSLAGEPLKLDLRSIQQCHEAVRKLIKKTDADDSRSRWVYYFIELLQGRSVAGIRKICQRIQISKELECAVVQAMDIRKVLKKLGGRTVKKSDIFLLLRPYDCRAIRYFRIKCTDIKINKVLDLYTGTLREISLNINGEDIKKLGTVSGKRIGQILESALVRKIDRGLKTKAQELKAVKDILAGN